eukprot:gene5668-9489_t
MSDNGIYNRMLFATLVVVIMNIYYMYYTMSYKFENDSLEKTMFENHKKRKEQLELGCLYRNFNETKHGLCPYSPENYAYWPRIPHLCILASNSCSTASHLFGENKFIKTSWSDFIFFDFFFTKHVNFKNIIEIESSTGIQSLFLGMISKLRNGQFTAINKNDNRLETVKRGWLKSMHLKKMTKDFEKSSLFSVNNLIVILHNFDCKLLTKLIPNIKSKHYFIILPRNSMLFKCLPHKKFQLKYEKFGSYFGSSYQILTKN